MALSAVGARAQTEMGRMLVGGGLSVSHLSGGRTYTNVSINSRGDWRIGINPSFHYFVVDDLAVGVDFSLGFQKNTQSYGIMPSATYYFNAGVPRLRPYVRGLLGYRGLQSKVEGVRSQHNSFMLGGKAGAAYFITRNLGVDLGITYSKELWSNQNSSGKEGLFGFSTGVVLYF